METRGLISPSSSSYTAILPPSQVMPGGSRGVTTPEAHATVLAPTTHASQARHTLRLSAQRVNSFVRSQTFTVHLINARPCTWERNSAEVNSGSSCFFFFFELDLRLTTSHHFRYHHCHYHYHHHITIITTIITVTPSSATRRTCCTQYFHRSFLSTILLKQTLGTSHLSLTLSSQETSISALVLEKTA